MWSPNELLKIEKQRDILSYITLQFFHFKKVPLEHCPFLVSLFLSFFPEGIPLSQVIGKGVKIFGQGNHRLLIAGKGDSAGFVAVKDLHDLRDIQVSDMMPRFFFRHGV